MNMTEMITEIRSIETLEAQLETAYITVTPYLMEIDEEYDKAKRQRDDVMRRIGSNNYLKIVKRERMKRREMDRMENR